MADDKQQSWADWLLEPFSLSISSPITESLSDSDESSYSHSTSAPSDSDNLAPYGLGILTGRGGAGNFKLEHDESLPVPELQRPKRLSERRKAAAKLEQLDTAAAIIGQPQRMSSPQYVTVGRGGAGNMQMLLPSMELLSPRSTSGSSARSPSYGSPVVGSIGRGGSGNYAVAAEANSRKQRQQQQEEMAAAEKKRGEIVEQVDALLSPPPSAFINGDMRRLSTSSSCPVD